ncbi:uncharacterized protein LOC143284728 [Babylonia areolata]|uniref:uncharacterized protein LOC143284728 n=1 Tax=Babylonia areolata TaxID=304850 RepID=UPI003FD25FA6
MTMRGLTERPMTTACRPRMRMRTRRGWCGGGGSGVGISLPVLCILWGTACWAQYVGYGAGPVNRAKDLPPSAYSQSSYFGGRRSSRNAANGNTTGTLSDTNCIQTAHGGRTSDRNPWWEVDLGSTTIVYNVRIWGPDGQLPRPYSFTITVDGALCVAVVNRTWSREMTVNCSQPLEGRVVRITRTNTTQWDFALTLCEFQVFACNGGYHGINCDLRCDRNCDWSGCYMNNGTCIRCRSGLYGDTCQHSCEDNTPGCRNCDRQGQCTFCSGNFDPPNCTVCKKNFFEKYDDRCVRCSYKCASRNCDPETGKCIGCSGSRYGDQCDKGCHSGCERCEQDSGACTKCNSFHQLPNCTECMDGYYKLTPESRYCSDCSWDCLNGTTCDKFTGRCPACPPGRTGSRCHSYCDSGTYGLNCSRKCGHCHYHSYCDREDGSCSKCDPGWQMPLCQDECEDGSYGTDCSEKCGRCVDGAVCNKETGACQLCEPGWYLPTCTIPCKRGLYGTNCLQECGSCLKNAVCNKTNGHCESCPIGKLPPLCDEDCQDKTYGQDCREKCGHCREGSVCDPVTGHCPQGCQSGWMDNTGLSVHLCDTACPAGLYGVQCNQTCGHCQSGSQCHHVSGECLQGCAEGFTGTHCTTATDQGSDGGPWLLYVVVAVLAALVFALLAVVVVLVYRSRRTRASGPGEGTHDDRNQPGHIELLPRGQQEENHYNEIDDLLSSRQRHDCRSDTVPLAAAAAAMATSPPAAGNGATADDSQSEIPPGQGETPQGRQRPVQAAGDISLAKFSNPIYLLDAGVSEEKLPLSAQRPATCDDAAVYENSTEDRQLHEKLQTCSEGVYETYGDAAEV